MSLATSRAKAGTHRSGNFQLVILKGDNRFYVSMADRLGPKNTTRMALLTLLQSAHPQRHGYNRLREVFPLLR
jgi:hypothetical protein